MALQALPELDAQYRVLREGAGLLDASTKLDGIYDLSILNKLLAAAGRPPVSDH